MRKDSWHMDSYNAIECNTDYPQQLLLNFVCTCFVYFYSPCFMRGCIGFALGVCVSVSVRAFWPFNGLRSTRNHFQTWACWQKSIPPAYSCVCVCVSVRVPKTDNFITTSHFAFTWGVGPIQACPFVRPRLSVRARVSVRGFLPPSPTSLSSSSSRRRY